MGIDIMRHVFARHMYETNTEDGVRRYLSGLGFDVGREITYEDGPTAKLVVAVQGPVVKKVKKLKK